MPETNDLKGIIRKVAEIIIGELKLEDVIGIDSMDLATIALVLQDEYKIVIDEDDYPKLKSIRLIADYISEKLSAKS